MGRKNRYSRKGCILHVMNHGVWNVDIFGEPKDKQMFLYLMAEMERQFDCKILGWCLMSNHYHILLLVGKDAVSKFMGRLQEEFAKYYNRRHGRKGHVFFDRFKSVVAKDEHYFLCVSRYIHLNPVRAGIVRNPLDYRYSSYKNYVHHEAVVCEDISAWGRSFVEPLVDTSKVLYYFSDIGRTPEERYREFVESALKDKDLEKQVQKDIGEDERGMPPSSAKKS